MSADQSSTRPDPATPVEPVETPTPVEPVETPTPVEPVETPTRVEADPATRVEPGSTRVEPVETPTIVLVGAPGSGKSTVGALLAARLGREFTDVDETIAAQAGKPVAEIFADEGEATFRRLEVEATLARVADPGVVSLGGGAVVSPEVRRALVEGPGSADHRTGNARPKPIVLWLRVSVGQSARRVGLNEPRPLLLGNVRGRLVALLAERTPLYEEVATHTVDTDEATPDEVVATITARLHESGVLDA